MSMASPGPGVISPKYHNLSPLLKDGLKALGLFNKNVDVDFKVPQQVQLGYYQEFRDDWSFTVDTVWIDMSEFGIEHVSIGTDHVSFIFRHSGACRTKAHGALNARRVSVTNHPVTD